MKYVDEFRDPLHVKRWVDAIASISTKPWTLMEICGGQTHNILKFGIADLLPGHIQIIHGPGCPVCVTPPTMIDAAVCLAMRSKTIICSFGDMLRVPGSEKSLLTARAKGGDVRVIYSPMDAVRLAQQVPDHEIIFFAVGFETTAPANGLALKEAKRLGLTNFSMIVSHVLVLPAIDVILSDADCRVQGVLAAGHVCSITGYQEYGRLTVRHSVPIVITGFEPVDILQGVFLCVQQLERGESNVTNQYVRSVKVDGNLTAQKLITSVFDVCDRDWRGIGNIADSGYQLRDEYRNFDALHKFNLASKSIGENPACIAGAILQGKLKPMDCPSFGKQCHPDFPLGAPMVSSEGACAAYYLYKKRALTHG